MKRLLLLMLCLLAAAPAARGEFTRQEMERTLAEASAAFDAGAAAARSDPAQARESLERAIAGYQRIIDEGRIVNGGLYYNIANAYMLQGDIGRAVLNYRRAQRFTPGDANIAANLAAARSRVATRIASSTEDRVKRTLLFWHYDLSAPARFVVFAGAFGAMWLLALLRLIGVVPRGVWWGIGPLALTWSASIASLVVEQRERGLAADAVVVAEQVVGRKGPDASAYEPSFTEPLSAGVEVRIVERRPRWILVRLPDGRETWMPESAIEVI